MSTLDKKELLDSILIKHKAQPVGSGYIDIIVHRNNYKKFIDDIISEGFSITYVTWWECIEDKEFKNRF